MSNVGGILAKEGEIFLYKRGFRYMGAIALSQGYIEKSIYDGFNLIELQDRKIIVEIEWYRPDMGEYYFLSNKERIWVKKGGLIKRKKRKQQFLNVEEMLEFCEYRYPK